MVSILAGAPPLRFQVGNDGGAIRLAAATRVGDRGGMDRPHHPAAARGAARAGGESRGGRGTARWLAHLAGAVREDVLPGWFASVMGTGIVAVAATLLPGHVPGVRAAAIGMWAAAAMLLVVLAGAAAGRWRRGGALRRQLGDPARAPFLGVPPMVAAATGAGLVAHAGSARTALLTILYALFGMGLVGSATVIALIAARLARHGTGPARTVPALWIVLGPLGQSVTAASLLGDAAGGRREVAFALWYGVPAWTCAMAWLVVVAVLTARTARRGLPFSAAWWGFVFPVGTVVTGTSRLAERTGSATLTAGAIALFIVLVAFWALTAARAVAAASPALR